MSEEDTQEHVSANYSIAKVTTAVAAVIAAQNQMLMHMTNRLGEAGLLKDTGSKDDYFAAFNKVLDETTELNAKVRELIVALQDEEIAAIRAKHEQ